MRGRTKLDSRTELPTRMKAVVFAAIFTMLLAACGGSGGGETESEAGGGTTDGGSETSAGGSEGASSGDALASCMDSTEPVELLVWGSRDYYLPPDRFEGFMEKYPHITIKTDVQANDDVLQQLQRMKQSGQKAPDIVHEDTFRVPDFQSGGLIRPVDDIMAQWSEEDAEQYEQILPITWTENEIDGQTWGMAIMANYDIVYYSKAWLEEAGVEPPFESFDELYDAMVKMKEARPDDIPLTIQALAGEGVTVLLTTASAAGVPFDGAVPDFTSEAGQYLLQWYMNAAKDELLPPEAINWGEAETRGAFISGNAGLIMDGITTASDFESVGGFSYDEEWLTTVLPTETTEGGPSGNWITSARTWMVTEGTEYPCEAGLVMRYIADEQVLLDTLEGGAVPMRHEGALAQAQDILPLFTEELQDSYIQAEPFPSGPNAGDVENVLEQMWGEVVTGQATDPKALAEKYQAQLEPLKP